MKKIARLGMIGVFAAAVAAPGFAAAATYAYVNHSGEVMTVEAATPQQAILTAPGRDEHSGVLLVDDPADSALKGTRVSGT